MFEFDSQKNKINQKKHGIDFQEAQKLWEDPELIELKSKLEAETRFIVIGEIEDKIWTAIITYRNNHICIISVRRARKEEEALYESRRFR